MSCVFILCELKVLTCFVITKPIIFPCLDSLILVENILKVEIIKKKKKKSERWRIDAFELCYWRRLLRVPWTARRANQSILKEINPEYSLEGLMLKSKLQYYGHLMRSTDIRKDPDAGKDWRQEEKGRTEDEMAGWHHWFRGHEFEQALGDGEGQRSLACCSPWGHKKLDMTE